jgi:hypothetical protein
VITGIRGWGLGKAVRLMARSFTPRLNKLRSESGCTLERQGKGNHEIWYSPVTERHFVVDCCIKSCHTANAVLRQAGLPKAF